ncbi:TPA: hypothetical protein ACXE54_003268 [Klebsiella michiganensis]
MSNDGLTLNQLAERNAVLVTEVEKLRAEREQLAAENVGLRPLIAENWNMRDLLRQLMAGRPGGVYFNKWEKLIIGVLNAPATDRIVAGIKADGVEEFAAYQRAITEEWACKEGHSSLLRVAESAELFAKQLREGKSEEVKS